MIQIRRHIFETNSSSTHTLILCSDDDYKAFVEGKLYYCQFSWGVFKDKFHGGKFYPVEEVDAFCKEHDTSTRDCFMKWEDLQNYVDDCNFEWFKQEMTTKSKEVIHAFGYFGYDG